MKQPTIARIASLEVHRDLSGGVRIKLAGQETVLSPAEAIRFGSAILRTAGCNVNFENAPLPMLGTKR